MLQNHPFSENQANQLLANCNKTTKRNTKETSFLSWTKPVKTDRQPKPYGQVQIQGREIVNIVNIHTSNWILFPPKKVNIRISSDKFEDM